MSLVLFADNFLAGAIISLVLPLGLLIAIAVWYVLDVRRFDAPTAETAAGSEAPPPPVDHPPAGTPG